MKTNLTAQLDAAASTNDIRGIKAPVEIPNEWLWLWITLAVVALVAAGVGFWLFLRKKKAMVPVTPPVPPHLRAKQKLAEALMFISDPNRFCTEVSNTLRVYLEERFNLRAPERTTEEFLVELRSSQYLMLDQKQSLGAFLESCDLVKFAKFEPNEISLRQLHDAALRLVDETQFVEGPAPLPIAAATVVAPTKQGPVSAEANGASPGMPAEEPYTLKERLIGLGLALAFLLIGVAMWKWPDLGLVPDEADPSGRGGRRLVLVLRVLEWLWSRPVGTILGFVGGAVLYGALTRRTKGPEQ
jgi:hypothetical protein